MKQLKFVRAGAALLALTMALSSTALAMSVEDARALLQEKYIDEIAPEILALPTIEEITTALGDPYTYYMTAEEYAAFQADLGDSATIGVGTMVEYLSTGLLISRLAPGSPAEQGGLRVGDLIVGVNDTTLEAAGGADALVLLIGGDAGTSVTLHYLRGTTRHSVTLKRAKVVFPVVEDKIVDQHIGWLTVFTFGENTGTYFKEYIEKEKKIADRWVVDLRGNPGGYATGCIEAAGTMVGNQIIANLTTKSGEMNSWKLNALPIKIDPLTDAPIIILQDANSASASELFAGALRDYNRALIIGTRSFGKGVAQDVFEQEDGSVMRITTQRYYSPKWLTPDHSGVLPHLVVDPNVAESVARLLCGGKSPLDTVLALNLAGQTFYVHKDAALGAEKDGFVALLEALAPNVDMTIGGKATTPAELAKAWGVSYESRYFTDLEGRDDADALNTLAALNLAHGTSATEATFEPDALLTRAQFASFLTQALGFWTYASPSDATIYTDVPADAWYAAPATILYRMDIMKGVADGQFDPDGTLTLEQMLTILARAGGRTDLTIQQSLEQPNDLLLSTATNANFRSWAQVGAAAMSEMEILKTPLHTLDPKTPITRADAGDLLYNLLAYSQSITVPKA